MGRDQLRNQLEESLEKNGNLGGLAGTESAIHNLAAVIALVGLAILSVKDEHDDGRWIRQGRPD